MVDTFISLNSVSTGSTNCRSKIFGKNYIFIEHVQTFFLIIIPYKIKYNNYECTTYIVLDITRNVQMI
jgi:hypothetical protein